MSKSVKKLSLISSIIFVLALGTTALLSQSKSNPPNKHKHLKATAKVSLPISVSINAPEEEHEEGDEFELEGVVSLGRSVEQIQVRWVLPEGIELMGGNSEYTHYPKDNERIHRTTLRVKALTDENAQIHFKVSGNNPVFKFSRTAQYNTVLQKQINTEIADIQQRQQEALQSR